MPEVREAKKESWMIKAWEHSTAHSDGRVTVKILERQTEKRITRPCDCTDCQFVTAMPDYSRGANDPIGADPKIYRVCSKSGKHIQKPDPRCRHWRPQKPDYAKTNKRRLFRMAS